jgi:hypothetical protein
MTAKDKRQRCGELYGQSISFASRVKAERSNMTYLQKHMYHRGGITASESRYPQYRQQDTHQERQREAESPLPGRSSRQSFVQAPKT